MTTEEFANHLRKLLAEKEELYRKLEYSLERVGGSIQRIEMLIKEVEKWKKEKSSSTV